MSEYELVEDEWMAIYMGNTLMCHHPFSTPEHVNIVLGCIRYYAWTTQIGELRLVRETPEDTQRILCEFMRNMMTG